MASILWNAKAQENHLKNQRKTEKIKRENTEYQRKSQENYFIKISAPRVISLVFLMKRTKLLTELH